MRKNKIYYMKFNVWVTVKEKLFMCNVYMHEYYTKCKKQNIFIFSFFLNSDIL